MFAFVNAEPHLNVGKRYTYLWFSGETGQTGCLSKSAYASIHSLHPKI